MYVFNKVKNIKFTPVNKIVVIICHSSLSFFVFVTINALTAQMAIIPEVADLSFRQAYALLRSLGFKNIEVKFVPGDYKDLAVGVERNAQMINRGERVPLASTLTLIISNGEKEIDSLSLDSLNVMPVESLNSDLEEWF